MLQNRNTANEREDFSVYPSFPLKCFTGKNLFCYDLAMFSSLSYSENYYLRFKHLQKKKRGEKNE